jgi:hypothetical protein
MSRLRSLANRLGLWRGPSPEPTAPATAAAGRRIVVQRVVPGRKGVAITLRLDPPEPAEVGEPLLRLSLTRLDPAGGPPPSPLDWVVATTIPIGPPQEGVWRANVNWPVAARWPAQGLFDGLSVTPLNGADRIELAPVLAALRPHLWPADEEAVVTAFSHRVSRFGDVDYQFDAALTLWARHASTPVRQRLALILGYAQLDLAAERSLPEAALALLETPWHPGQGPLPTLELRRRVVRWHRALCAGDVAGAQALIDQAIVPIDALADPLVAAEQVMRSRAIRQILLMQAQQLPLARQEGEALLHDLMAVTEHADPRRLRAFIDHRKCFQLTSLARKLVRPRTLQQPAEVRRVLDLAFKSAVNVGAQARQRIAQTIGVDHAG